MADNTIEMAKAVDPSPSRKAIIKVSATTDAVCALGMPPLLNMRFKSKDRLMRQSISVLNTCATSQATAAQIKMSLPRSSVKGVPPLLIALYLTRFGMDKASD